MKKKLAHFFADTLRSRELTDEDELTLQKILFPSLEEDASKAIRESTADMMAAFGRWEAKHAKHEQTNTVMTDEEIEALANIM